MGTDTSPLNIRMPESASINASDIGSIVEENIDISGSVVNELYKKNILYLQCEHACENLLRFMFHITLISIFETIFFFKFVSVDEDRGILTTTNFFTQGLISKCANFSYNETAIINYILRDFVNTSQVITAGAVGLAERNIYNMGLNNLSWKYVGALSGLMLGVVTISLCCKFKIRWIYIFVENIVLVSMLGLYEFMFFETIVKKYKTETPQEISSLFVQQLQDTCRLLV